MCIHIDMSIHMCIGMCIDMCIDTCAHMSMYMSIHMCIHVSISRCFHLLGEAHISGCKDYVVQVLTFLF